MFASEDNYRSPRPKAEDFGDEKGGKTIEELASALWDRASSAKESLQLKEKNDWTAAFVVKSLQRKRELTLEWDSKWKELCNGKQLFRDLQQAGVLKMAIGDFQGRIISLMKERKSDNWRLAESELKQLLAKSS